MSFIRSFIVYIIEGSKSTIKVIQDPAWFFYQNSFLTYLRLIFLLPFAWFDNHETEKPKKLLTLRCLLGDPDCLTILALFSLLIPVTRAWSLHYFCKAILIKHAYKRRSSYVSFMYKHSMLTIDVVIDYLIFFFVAWYSQCLYVFAFI